MVKIAYTIVERCATKNICERFLKQTHLRCDCDQPNPPRDMAGVRAITYNDTPG